jgi:hypothetical protein
MVAGAVGDAPFRNVVEAQHVIFRMTSRDIADFIRSTLARGLMDGAALAVTTSAALAAVSTIERGSPWAAINPICHIVDGDDRTYSDGFDKRDSYLGLALNGSVMLAWGVLHAAAFGRAKGISSMAAGLTTAAAAYAIDYRVVPRRFTPGIEKVLSRRSILVMYVVLGLTMGFSGAIDGRQPPEAK